MSARGAARQNGLTSLQKRSRFEPPDFPFHAIAVVRMLRGNALGIRHQDLWEQIR